jgi:hypothetical protein
MLVQTNELFAETRYVFKMDIPVDELTPITKGVFEFRFACNKDLKNPYKLNEDDPFETVARQWALRYAICEQCGGVQKNHFIRVINPQIAFDHLTADKDFKRSLRLAKKNLEWLILPNDIINNGFRAARIQPANFWKVQGYTMEGEEKRNPFTVPYDKY